MKNPLLIAHRGESRDAPENTLAALDLAWERGAAAVEVDVRLSADGVPVVIHDATTRRIGGASLSVCRQSAARLTTIDAGAWKHPRWRGTKIPLLHEVLCSVPAGRRIFLELKEGPETVGAVSDVLKVTRFPQQQLTAMSFRRATALALRKSLLEAEICLLLSRRHWEKRAGIDRAIEFARAHRLNALNLEDGPRLNSEVIDQVHHAGLAVYCWTVNRVGDARRLFRSGIDGVTTDRCAWMSRQLAIELS